MAGADFAGEGIDLPDFYRFDRPTHFDAIGVGFVGRIDFEDVAADAEKVPRRRSSLRSYWMSTKRRNRASREVWWPFSQAMTSMPKYRLPAS